MKKIRFITVVLAVLFVIVPLLHFVQAKSTGGPEPSLILYLPFDEGEGDEKSIPTSSVPKSSSEISPQPQ